MKRYYMHTLDGQPAIFQDDMIVNTGKSIKVSDMATSLAQIRREQKIDKAYCEKYRVSFQYGYVRVYA